VCAATYRDLQTTLPSESDPRDDVVRIRASNDDRRMFVDGAIPDNASLVVSGVACDKHLSGDGRA
jgi:hypothetical protein